MLGELKLCIHVIPRRSSSDAWRRVGAAAKPSVSN
jgi:hypothetical protein